MRAKDTSWEVIWAEISTIQFKNIRLENIFHLTAFALSLLNNSVPLESIFSIKNTLVHREGSISSLLIMK